MKKRFFKIISCFLIVFTLSLSFSQERQKVNVHAEVITLTTGTIYIVSQILVAVGIVATTELVTYSVAESYMNWLDENNTEQAEKIRSMTPVSCGTPGSIEEEQLKEAYKYKAKLQSGEITLPSVKALQTFNELGTNSIVNTSSYDFDYVRSNNIDYKNTYNINTIIRFKKAGTYKLTFNLTGSQSYWTSMTKVFYFQALENYSIQFYSCTFKQYANAPYSLAISFMDSDNNLKNFYSFDRELTSLPGGYVHEDKTSALQTSTFQDTFSYNLECVDGSGMAISENTVEKEISPDDITYPDSTIPASDAGSICINVPDNIANSWDTPATSDVISSDSAITNENGDVWDSARGWVSQEVDGILGVLGDILGAIKGIGKDVWDFFEEILNGIKDKIGDVIDAINSLTWVDVISAITGVPSAILQGIAEALGLEGLFSNVIDTIKSIPLSIYNLFDSILSSILDAINGIVDGIIDGLKKLFIPTLSFKDSIDTLKEKFVLPKLSLPSSDIKKEPLKLNKTVDISILNQSYTIDITLDQDWFPILREIMLGLMVLALVFFAQRKTSAFFAGGDD